LQSKGHLNLVATQTDNAADVIGISPLDCLVLLTPSFLVAIGFFSPKRVGWGADNLFIAFDHAGCRLTSGRTARPLA